MDNAHWNRIAALTLALAEMEKFGSAYTEQVIRNSQTLAKAWMIMAFQLRAQILVTQSPIRF